MKRTKIIVSTSIVAAIVVPYVGYVINGEMPFIKDARGMAAVGIILLFAWGLLVRSPFGEGWAAYIAGGIGIATLTLGIVAGWLESDVVLVPFVAGIVMLWFIALAMREGGTPSRS
jgi:hypothetical protein